MNALLLAVIVAATPAPAGNPQVWHRVVGLLEYLEGDYAKAIASGDTGVVVVATWVVVGFCAVVEGSAAATTIFACNFVASPTRRTA